MSVFATVSQFPAGGPLSGLVSLSARVGIYVPTTIHNRPATSAEIDGARERAASLLSRLFGGYTEVRAAGGWDSPAVGLVRETVYIVSANCTPAALSSALPEIVRFVRRLAFLMSQECVALDVNGALYFVPSADSAESADVDPADPAAVTVAL